MGKREFRSVEENPEEDNKNNSSLFCFDLESPFRERDTILLKRRRLNNVDGYKYLQRTPSPVYDPTSTSSHTYAEKELMCVEN